MLRYDDFHFPTRPMDDIDSVSLVKVVARPADDDGDATVTERQWAVAAVARAAHASFAVALTSSAGTERWHRALAPSAGTERWHRALAPSAGAESITSTKCRSSAPSGISVSATHHTRPRIKVPAFTHSYAVDLHLYLDCIHRASMANKLMAFSIVAFLTSCGGITAQDDGGIDAIVGADAGLARDAGVVDAGAGGGASLADAGAQQDTGSPDAGAVGVDAGAAAVDAGAAAVDAGAVDMDAGVCELPVESDVQTVLSVGHVDVLDVGLGCGGLHLALADGTDRLQSSFETLRAPESVLLHGSPALLTPVPSHVEFPELAFLGPEGSNIYLFPETQADGALWPGVKSQRVPSGAVAGDSLFLVLESASGPGPFFAFHNLSPGMPLRLLFDADGGHTEAALPVQTQSQPNWAFPSAGLHRLVFSTKAQLADGGVLSSPPRNYRFFLGELSDLPASEPTVIAVTGLNGSYTPGETMMLEVQRFGAPSMLPVQWERQCYRRGDAGELLEDAGFFLREEWSVLPAPNGVLATLPDSSCQYRASLMDGPRRVATTQAVLPNVN